MNWFSDLFGIAPQPAQPVASFSEAADPAKVGLFVSFNHKDVKLADALAVTLTSLSAELSVFIDHSGLEGGDDYEKKISESIKASQWFVMISNSGSKPAKDMSWCFYEAGQFRAKLEAANQLTAVRDRICYLYDGERPTQLARYQGSLVSTIDRSGRPLNTKTDDDDCIGYEKTEVFSFLELILNKSLNRPLRDVEDANIRKLMRGGVRRIISAFEESWVDIFVNEDVFQPRISFMIPPPSGKEAPVLNANTAIASEFNALPTIFSIAGASATWAEIKAKSVKTVANGMMPLWVDDLEAAVEDMAEGGVPRQTDFLCLGNDQKYYRPIIARNENFRNKNKKCYVAFIPSRDRRFNLGFKTSLLLSALILSVRFRQRVLPLVDDLKRLDQAQDARKAELLQKIQNEIVLVEAEAMEFGLSPPRDEHDEPPLLSSFRDGPSKEFFRGQIVKWSTTRMRIFDTIAGARNPADKATKWSDAAGLVIASFDSMAEINGAFIDMLCTELLYAEKIERERKVDAVPAAAVARTG